MFSEKMLGLIGAIIMSIGAVAMIAQAIEFYHKASGK